MAKVRIKLNTNLADEVFPRKLSKSELRQLQIIEKSIHLCAKDGIEALSYERIAKACGVTRHLVIHYFPDRQDIIEQATEYVWASLKLTILGRVDREKGAVARMKAYLSSNLEWMRDNPELAKFFLLFLHYASTKTRFYKLSTDLFKLGQQRILGILLQGIDEGVFAKIQNPELEAKDIQISVLGQVVSYMVENQPFASPVLEVHLIESIMGRLAPGH
jgi:AcrR family transcriptional regulator